MTYIISYGFSSLIWISLKVMFIDLYLFSFDAHTLFGNACILYDMCCCLSVSFLMFFDVLRFFKDYRWVSMILCVYVIFLDFIWGSLIFFDCIWCSSIFFDVLLFSSIVCDVLTCSLILFDVIRRSSSFLYFLICSSVHEKASKARPAKHNTAKVL